MKRKNARRFVLLVFTQRSASPQSTSPRLVEARLSVIGCAKGAFQVLRGYEVKISGDAILNIRRSKRNVAVVTTLILVVVAPSLCGCNSVRRRLTIRTDPPGAIVYLNDEELGRAPISKNFVYSGTYKIRCYKEGYEMEERLYKAGTPWYLYPGVDFFSENFTPGELRDEQVCNIELTPKRTVPDDELFEEATKLREEAHNNSQIKYGASASSR